MKRYTVGFIFDAEISQVVLIQKNRPDWQKGKLNGIGGRIEEVEESVAGMVREAQEETGLKTKPEQWVFLGTIERDEYGSVVDFYALIHNGMLEEIVSCTDESVEWYAVDNLPDQVLTNIPWLVAYARDRLQNKVKHKFMVRYE